MVPPPLPPQPPPVPPTPLEYRVPQVPPFNWRRHVSTSLFVVVGVAWLIHAVIVVGVVPRFAEIFKDFGLRLPSITKALVDSSRALNSPFAVLGIGSLAALLAWGLSLLTWRGSPEASRSIRRTVTLLLVLLILAKLAVVAAALMVPMATLTEGISNSGGGVKK